jgi:DHA1 family bicyclomycin/chloramphenicol resistance-like MFS transporter
VFFSFLSGGPVIAADLLGLSGTEFGLYFTCIPGGYMLGNFLTARFSQRFGIAFMTVFGSIIAVFGVVVMGVAFALGWHHPLWLFVPMSIGGLANGITFTNAIAGAVSLRPDLAGAAAGLAGALQTTGGAVASVVVGLLFTINHSIFTLIACMAIFAVASLAAALWTRTTRNA